MESLEGDARLQRFGIAKLLGTRDEEVLEYFMQKYYIVLGRNSKNSQVDVVLGDSMSLSRKHAAIKYNFEGRYFELLVMGKNGVNIDGDVVTPDTSPRMLHSGDRIRTGACDFFFLLPSATPVQTTEPAQAPRNGIASDAQLQAHPVEDGRAHASPDPADLPIAMAHNPADGMTPALVNTAGMNVGSPGSSSPMQVDGASPITGPPQDQPMTSPVAAAVAAGPVQPGMQSTGSPVTAPVTAPVAEAAVVDAVARMVAQGGGPASASQPSLAAAAKLAEALSTLPPEAAALSAQLQGGFPPQ